MRSKVFAVAFALSGVAALLFVAGRLGYIRLSPRPAAPPIESAIAFEGELPNYTTLLTPDNVRAEVAAGLQGARARAGEQLAALPSSQRDALWAEAERDATMFLSGSWEDYSAWLDRTGAQNAVVRNARDPDKARASLRSFWESVTEPIKLRPIDPSRVIVRARHVRGRSLGDFPEDALIVATAGGAHQFPHLPQDPRRGEMTITEVLIPVMYIVPPDVEHGWLGIWYAWDTRDSAWRIWRTHIATYERPSKVGIVPAF